MATGYGRAIGLLESVYLYCPDARRLINNVLETRLEVSSEYASELNARYSTLSALPASSLDEDTHSRKV